MDTDYYPKKKKEYLSLSTYTGNAPGNDCVADGTQCLEAVSLCRTMGQVKFIFNWHIRHKITPISGVTWCFNACIHCVMFNLI
jgi:hypothetical protein